LHQPSNAQIFFLSSVGQINELDMIEQNAEHIAEPSELAAVAADLFEDLLLEQVD
jgi:hypothetical protein